MSIFKGILSAGKALLGVGGPPGVDNVMKVATGIGTYIDERNYTEEERAARGIKRFPTTQAEALAALEQDEVLMEALGPILSQSYLAVKRSEYAADH